MPVAIVVAGANVPDMKLAAPTLAALVVERPRPSAERPQHPCLDAGYDYDLPRFAAERRNDRPHIRPRRWVVERLHNWLNHSRRLLVRWEKLERTYAAFLHLACALLCFQQCDRVRTA